MMVVITGDLGQGKAKPINHMTGKSATWILTAIRKASISGTCSNNHSRIVVASGCGGPEAVNLANFGASGEHIHPAYQSYPNFRRSPLHRKGAPEEACQAGTYADS